MSVVPGTWYLVAGIFYLTFLSSTTRSFGPTFRAARAMFARARSCSSSDCAIRMPREDLVLTAVDDGP